MARSLDDIFGNKQQKSRTLEEIFAPPKVEPQKLSNQELSQYLKVSHTPFTPEPQSDLSKGYHSMVANSAIGGAVLGLEAKLLGPQAQEKLQEMKSFQPSTLPGKAISLVGRNVVDAPLWMIGEAAAGKLLSPLAKTAPIANLASKLPKPLAPILGGGIKDAVTYGSVVAPAETVASGDGLKGLLDREKQLPAMALGGMALRGVGAGIGKGLEIRANNKLNKQVDSLLPQLENKPLQDVQNAFKAPSLHDVRQGEYEKIFKNVDAPSTPNNTLRAENPSQYFGKSQSDLESVFPPREVKSFKFSTPEQRAMDELNEGMQTAQNYIGHSDILAAYPPGTSIEAAYKDIKTNTGVDIPKLTENLLAAQRKNASLTPERLMIGKAAGVIPDLKPRETPKLELPFQPKKVEISTPEPRQWTNAEQIQARSNPFNPFDVPKKIELPAKATLKNPLQVAAAEIETPSATIENVPKIDYTKIKDITGFEGSSKDMYRILEQRLGKEAADEMMDPFTQSKGDYAGLQSNLANEMKSVIVDNLGIKKGSKESALIQKYGEGGITLDELKTQSPDKWQNIVKADLWFREKYNQLIDQINATKREIYPNAEANVAKIEKQIEEVRADKSLTSAERSESLKSLQSNLEDAARGKIIPKRTDYYRHFQEMKEGLSGLKNIFENPTMIDPRLEGKTSWTKPKAKWASITQQRTGNKTEYDAVGGFLNYLPQAAYAIHIDPHISRFRALADDIADATVDTKNANNLVRTLQNYANDLSGKTNPADRYMMENIPGGRTTVAALGWLQNRIKSNVILGNLGSAVSQVANVPNGIAFAKQYSAEGAARTLKTIFKPSEEMMQSPFLKERFGGPGSKVYQQFDTSLLNKPKQFATWVLNTADKLGSEFVWNSAYAKGKAEGVENLVKYADDATRKLIAGRGIGEVPLMYKSKIVGLMAPFQLEVGNLWHVQKDMVSSKDFAGIATLYLSMYLFNRLSEDVKGFGVTFDPIQAVIDASQPNLTPLQRGGRVLGEVASNVPFGQNMAKVLVPEYGGSVQMPGGETTLNLPSRKELFGKNDPTRFGTSNLIFDSLSNPQKAAQNLILPFGGGQVAKTIKGIEALQKGGVYDKTGTKLSYPVSPTLPNQIKASLFGTSGLPESRNYYDKNRRPLTETQTKKVDSSSDRLSSYEKLMEQRKADALKAKMKELEEAMKKATK
jgi:hypothetical protein